MPSSEEQHVLGPGAQGAESSERFARLFSRYQQDLFSYILFLVGSPADASDVLQETSVLLLRKIDQFDEGRPFMPWAKKFAYYAVLNHRRASSKCLPLFDEKVLEQVNEQIESFSPLMDTRREALDRCLGKLPKQQLDMIKMRYIEDIKPAEISDLTMRPVQTVYTQLKRIRQALLECINRSLQQEANS